MEYVYDINHALIELAPTAEYSIVGSTYSGLNWLSPDITKPTEAEVNAKIAELNEAEPMRLLREKRDQLLAETDWWVLPDVNVTPAQLTYRQALRDLPVVAVSVGAANVVFPVKPTYGGTR